MERRTFIGVLSGGLLAAPLAAQGQEAGKIYRIGLILTGTPTEAGHLIKALSDGLRELGYVEGRNVVFEKRFAEGRQGRLPPLAVEPGQLKVDVLVTGSYQAIGAGKRATAT